jgi:hypothetical protein
MPLWLPALERGKGPKDASKDSSPLADRKLRQSKSHRLTLTEWDVGRNYFKGDNIERNGVTYTCVKDHYSVELNRPGGHPDYCAVC